VTPHQSFGSVVMHGINQLLLAACFQLLDEVLGTEQMTGIVRQSWDEQSEIQAINGYHRISIIDTQVC